MRVEFWPSVAGEKPGAFFTFDLPPEIMDELLESNFNLVSQFSRRCDTFSSGLRYRIKSPVLFLTVCQGKQKQVKELGPIVDLLKGNIEELQWEIHMPTTDWDIEVAEAEEIEGLSLEDIEAPKKEIVA